MKSIRVSFKFIILFFLFGSTTVQAAWSFLIYADPADGITEAVVKNISDLVQSYSSPNAQVYVQLRVFIDKDANKSHAWRYKIHNNCLQWVETVEMTQDFYTDVTSAMQWAYGQKNFQTNYFGLLFSGHGCGILEPQVLDQSGNFAVEQDSAQCITCNRHAMLQQKRSILLNDFTHQAMDNVTMLKIMNFGSTLIGKKIDVVGFDLCLGAMLEHAYQLAPYAQYLVGYQYCAATEGFDYFSLGSQLQDVTSTPNSLVQNLVKAHGIYSLKNSPNHSHTLSVLDCSVAADVAKALDEFVLFCMEMMQAYPYIVDEIMTARKNSYHACWVPMYTDVYQVVSNIAQNMLSFLTDQQQVQLQALVQQLQAQIESMVVEKYTSQNLSHLHGINIYFPYNHIDTSYYWSPFAQNSKWLQFLEMVVK